MNTGRSSSCGATGIGLCYSRARIRWCYSPTWPFGTPNSVIKAVAGLLAG